MDIWGSSYSSFQVNTLEELTNRMNCDSQVSSCRVMSHLEIRGPRLWFTSYTAPLKCSKELTDLEPCNFYYIDLFLPTLERAPDPSGTGPLSSVSSPCCSLTPLVFLSSGWGPMNSCSAWRRAAPQLMLRAFLGACGTVLPPLREWGRWTNTSGQRGPDRVARPHLLVLLHLSFQMKWLESGASRYSCHMIQAKSFSLNPH